MRIPSGKVDQRIHFVANDATDFETRLTGLSSFTVYRSRNGGTPTAMTTPTVTELDATNMPGEYALLIDEDTTIASGSDSEEMILSISHAGMARVTRVIELYRRDTTSGQTIAVATGGVEVATFQAGAITAAAIATGAIDADAIATDAVTEIQSGLATAANLATVAGYLDTEIASILADTNELQTDWANGGRLDLILDARASQTSVDDLPTNAELTTALSGFATSADLATVDGNVDAIKAKTDSLTFTVANQIDANIQYVNDSEVTGAGTAGDPWGP